MNKVFLGLLAFVPFALIAGFGHMNPVLIFVLSALALIPLAHYIGDATEELSARTTPALAGLLNATFGNAPELIIGVLALQAGLVELVKASIIGSVIGNLLLVLGTAIFFGSRTQEKQTFNATAAKAAASMLLLATLALVIPALFAATSANAAGGTVLLLSIAVSILMIVAYVASLFFSLRTHKHLYEQQAEVNEAHWSQRKSILVLIVATIAVAFVSDQLVSAVAPVVQALGWTQLFIGVVVIAIVGNVAEHASAIRAAIKDRMDLALAIAVGSASQIVMFVAPLLVLISLLLHPMDLVFSLFELVALVFSVFVTNAVIEDGESNWLEGIQLVVAYIIIAVAFFLFA